MGAIELPAYPKGLHHSQSGHFLNQTGCSPHFEQLQASSATVSDATYTVVEAEKTKSSKNKPEPNPKWLAEAQKYEKLAESSDSRYDWSEAAKYYHKLEDHAKAAKYYEKAGWWFNAGWSYIDLSNDYDNALRCFKNHILEGHKSGLEEIKKLYAEKKIAITEDEMSAIEGKASEIFATKTGDELNAWRSMGVISETQNSWAEAARYYEKSSCWFLAGSAFIELNDYSNALRCFKMGVLGGSKYSLARIEKMYFDKKIDMTEGEMSEIRDQCKHAV
jgi:tetratricopeptide (TPR) repeat protein